MRGVKVGLMVLKGFLLSRVLFAAFDGLNDDLDEPANEGDDDALLIARRRSQVVFLVFHAVR